KAKAKFPLPTEDQLNHDFHRVDIDFPAESEAGNETETKPNRANALVVASDDDTRRRNELKKKYMVLVEGLNGKPPKEVWQGLKAFVVEQNPDWIEPYVDTWNIFASFYKLAHVASISDSRRRKFS